MKHRTERAWEAGASERREGERLWLRYTGLGVPLRLLRDTLAGEVDA